MSMVAKAWEVGDFYLTDDHVPSMVVYVDSTGEHGLRMAPIAMNDTDLMAVRETYAQKIKLAEGNLATRKRMDTDPKFYQKMMKIGKGLAVKIMDSVVYEYEHTHEAADYTLNFVQNLPMQNHYSSLKKNQMEQMLEQIENGADGEVNTKEIIRYCEKNDINLESAFPHVYYATLLGPNWFVPGTHELELVAEILTKGVGQYTEQKEYYAPKLSQYDKKVGYLKLFFPIKSLKSSTFVGGQWGNGADEQNMIDDNFDRINQKFYSLYFEWWNAGNFFHSKEKQGHVCYFFVPDISGEHVAFCRF